MNKGWSIPKGQIDPGEGKKDAAVRETFEECGAKIKKSEIKLKNSFTYKSFKDGKPVSKTLYVFEYEAPKEWLKKKFKCTSFFTDENGKKTPEINNFGWYTKQEAIKIVFGSMKALFT